MLLTSSCKIFSHFLVFLGKLRNVIFCAHTYMLIYYYILKYVCIISFLLTSFLYYKSRNFSTLYPSACSKKKKMEQKMGGCFYFCSAAQS